MNPIIRNILAVVLGWFGGSVVNMGIVQLGHSLKPIEGIDPNNMEALAEVMPTLGFEHLIYPLLAHGLGTFVGAAIAFIIAANHKMKFAFAIGVLFLLGGIMVSFMLPAPTWFVVTDLIFAYIPMAWLGGTLAKKVVG